MEMKWICMVIFFYPKKERPPESWRRAPNELAIGNPRDSGVLSVAYPELDRRSTSVQSSSHGYERTKTSI